jgi:hypothetical protein
LIVISLLSYAFIWPAFAQAGESRKAVHRIVVHEAVRNRSVPPSLALAVARVESNFDPLALSHAGARGVMQIMPSTAWSEFHVRAGALWDARMNAQLGIRYLERLYHQYGGRWDLALSHYNGGSIKRDRRGRLEVHDYTRRYVDKVLRISRRYERDASVAVLVRRTRQSSKNDANADEADQAEFAYWMYDEPGADRDWRDYLRAADHWLEKADPQPQPARSASDRDDDGDEALYWDEAEPNSGPDGYQGRKPSRAVRYRVLETRRRFRERLASDQAGRRG